MIGDREYGPDADHEPVRGVLVAMVRLSNADPDRPLAWVEQYDDNLVVLRYTGATDVPGVVFETLWPNEAAATREFNRKAATLMEIHGYAVCVDWGVS